MKKLLLSFVVCVIHMHASLAQAPPPPSPYPVRPYPYTDDFESYPVTGSVSAGGWTGTSGLMLFSAYTGHGAGTPASKGLTKEFYNLSTTGGFFTPKVLQIGSNAEIRFNYRMAEYIGATATAAASLPADFSLVISLSTDSGATFNALASITPSNNTSSLSFGSFSYSLAAYAGADVILRIAITRGSSGDFFVDIDNFAIDAATPVRLVKADDLLLITSGKNITLQNVPPAFAGTRVVLYDLTGQAVSSGTAAPGNSLMLEAPVGGVYFVSLNNGQKLITRKVVVQ